MTNSKNKQVAKCPQCVVTLSSKKSNQAKPHVEQIFTLSCFQQERKQFFRVIYTIAYFHLQLILVIFSLFFCQVWFCCYNTNLPRYQLWLQTIICIDTRFIGKVRICRFLTASSAAMCIYFLSKLTSNALMCTWVQSYIIIPLTYLFWHPEGTQ